MRERRKCGNCSLLGHYASTCESPGARTARSITSTEYGAANADAARARAAEWKFENPNALAEWYRERPHKTGEFEARRDPERTRETSRARYAVNPTSKIEGAKRWYRNNPVTARRNQLCRNYGITPEQWDAILEFQDRCCAICGSDDPGSFGWTTEHNHDTGQIRGITCSPCNSLLGRAGDDAENAGLTCLRLLSYLASSGDYVSDEIAGALIDLLALRPARKVA